MEPIAKSFIFNLRRLRKSQGYTQAEFAEKVGMSVRGYQKYEQGESEPPYIMKDAIAKALGCTVADLYKDPAKNEPLGDPRIPRDIVADIVAETLKQVGHGDLLTRIEALPPNRRAVVLYLITKDERYLVGLGDIDVDLTVRALGKVL